jgi:hypothetical protein
VLDRMVLGTSWVILRWFDKMIRRRGSEEKTDKEKMRDRLEIISRESSLLRVVSDVKSKECEVSKIQNEILSVRAVLEIKMEEVRGLRKELERRRWWKEDMGTQTTETKEENESSGDETCR